MFWKAERFTSSPEKNFLEKVESLQKEIALSSTKCMLKQLFLAPFFDHMYFDACANVMQQRHLRPKNHENNWVEKNKILEKKC